MTPRCPKPEWIDRATMALGRLLPELPVADVAEIVNGHLWDEACDLEPEEAAEIYAMECPPE